MRDELKTELRQVLRRSGCEEEFIKDRTNEVLAIFDKVEDVIIEEKSIKKVEDLREKITADVRSEFTIAKSIKITKLSPFISETVEIDGLVLSREDFIPRNYRRDPLYDDKQLLLNTISRHWQLQSKTKGPQFVSSVEVYCSLIVGAIKPGMCYATLVFIKGKSSPLVFFDGDFSEKNIIAELELEDKSLKNKYVAEAFRRSLMVCPYVFFFPILSHAGWNITPDGLRIFVSSALDVPLLGRLFGDEKKRIRNIFQDIVLFQTNRTFKEIKEECRQLPDILPVKIGIAISVMSRLLPHYNEAGLAQDRLFVVETPDDDTAKALIAVMQNRNYNSLEVIFSSMRMPHIEKMIKSNIDCVAILRHSCAIGSAHDFGKILNYLFELLQTRYADDSINRFVPVLLVDNAGIIPEEFGIHQLSIPNRISSNYIVEKNQKLIAELNYHIIKLVEGKPDLIMNLIIEYVASAKEIVKTIPRKSQSNSAVMLLTTVLLLKDFHIMTKTDTNDIVQWLCTEAKLRTSMSGYVYKTIGELLSKLICSGSLPIANQFSPPFWTPNKAFVASDDSLNVTKDTFEDLILSEISIGRNKALQYLKEADVLFTNKGEDQKTFTVETEDGKRKPRRFYSLSRDLLTPKANRIVDEATVSDLFHKPDEPIDNFFPFIKHRRLDMVAGQVITDYKHGNTFIDVTGSVGSGKSDWMMMQVVQRAKAGDVVVVLDPTNAFCREELLGHKIPDEILNKHFMFWDMSMQGWPVNILDFEDCDDLTQRVQKLSSLLISGMHLTGVNQKALVSTTAKDWLMECEFDNKLSIYDFPDRFVGDPNNEKLKMRLDALLSTVKDMGNTVQPPGWDKLLSERGKVLVISAGSATINVEANPFDVLLDTIYSFKDKNRDAKLTLVLDEVQTLNHHKSSTLVNILSRVRKLNISAMLASQDYSNISLKKIYDYCGTHILFRPLGEECIKAVAELTKLDISVIRTLPDFCCAIMGSIYSKYNQKNIQLSSAVIGETYRPSYVRNYDINERP